MHTGVRHWTYVAARPPGPPTMVPCFPYLWCLLFVLIWCLLFVFLSTRMLLFFWLLYRLIYIFRCGHETQLVGAEGRQLRGQGKCRCSGGPMLSSSWSGMQADLHCNVPRPQTQHPSRPRQLASRAVARKARAAFRRSRARSKKALQRYGTLRSF